MPDKRTLILNHIEIQQKTSRIAYQIWEDNFYEESIVLGAIAERGYIFAERLKGCLEKICPDKSIEIIKIVINKNKRSLEATTNADIHIAKNKVLILVDDVLNSGRTLAYGLGVFLDIPLKKMRTAVLIDRSHHLFPIFSDYYGLRLSTVLKEHIHVSFSEKEGTAEDAAWLY